MPGKGLRIESLLLSVGKRLMPDFMLREVGGGYILIQRLLMEHYTGMELQTETPPKCRMHFTERRTQIRRSSA
jgi:hypothetical protein